MHLILLLMSLLRLHYCRGKSPVTLHLGISISQQLKPLNLYIKRDDQLQGVVNGNKGRKFIDLMQLLNARDELHVISYGGTQSNSMGAIAKLVSTINKEHKKNHTFTYYTKKLSEIVRKSMNEESNFNSAINMFQMQHIEVAEEKYGEIAELVNKKGLFSEIEDNKIYVPIGGYGLTSRKGCQSLARELADDIADIKTNEVLTVTHLLTHSPNHLLTHSQDSIKKVLVLFACGTGTTAFYTTNELNKLTSKDRVMAVPCVGDGEYLQKQMESLPLPGSDQRQYPLIIDHVGKSKPFGSVNKYHYNLWSSLQAQLQLQLDLLYFPKCMDTFIAYLESDAGQTLYNEILTNQVALLYYHCGGVEGNASQLRRYKHANIL